ncbi:MAG: AraC family transcriptional regulator [Anaerolineales bacterium]|nr:AraC family transcriptional regulator [Anaerolineales bacterium]
MTKAYIERYFGEQCLVPALKAIGQSRQVEAREGMLPHHELYYEFHLVLDGAVTWWVEDEIYPLQPGSVFVTKPGETHGSVENLVQPSQLTWLQVDAMVLPDSSMQAELAALQQRTWLGANDLVGQVQQLLVEIRQPQPDSPRLVRAHLQLFLAQLLRQYGQRRDEPHFPPQFEALMVFIEARLTAVPPLTIDDLCQQASLSRSRIFQLFEQHVGQSPISYINSRRIEKAKQMLRTSGKIVTDIGLELGYSSSQHFATAFKRITGLTPSDYRQLEIIGLDSQRREIGRLYQHGHWH